jgi:hypothetical protein
MCFNYDFKESNNKDETKKLSDKKLNTKKQSRPIIDKDLESLLDKELSKQH